MRSICDCDAWCTRRCKQRQEPHDFEWLVETLYEKYIEEGEFHRSKKKDQQNRDKADGFNAGQSR